MKRRLNKMTKGPDSKRMKPSKIFRDAVHGHIEFHPLLVKIIDTPLFQRLRNVKQLGLCYYVYPTACHNRFEHSLGTSHLAGKFARSLQQRQQGLKISDRDILCLEIAGLCHDLGHGPFSHLYDNEFISRVKPGSSKVKPGDNWTHEEASCDLLDELFTEDFKKDFEDANLVWEEDIEFVKHLIHPPDTKKHRKDKLYLYQIISNKETGIDVDKWDYFVRDCHGLGHASNFDYDRFIKFSKVLEGDKELHICHRRKELPHVYDMFMTRFRLHRDAYQHPVVDAVERMVVDAFVEFDKVPFIKNGKRELLTLSECIEDMTAYRKLDDSVFQIILNADPEDYEKEQKEGVKKAQEILVKLQKRELYKMEGAAGPFSEFGKTPEMVEEEVFRRRKGGQSFSPDDFFVKITDVHFGKKERNPLNNLYCFNKDEETVVKVGDLQASAILVPKAFRERTVRVYSKVSDERKRQCIRDAFEEWRQVYEAVSESETTPKNSSKASSSCVDQAAADKIRKNLEEKFESVSNGKK